MSKDQIILLIFNNKMIDRYCKVIDNENWNELKSELMIQLYDMKEFKLIQHHNNKILEYICFVIIKRIKYGNIKNTYFHNKNRFNELTGDIEIIEEDDKQNHNLDKITDIVNSQNWYDKIMFEYYFKDGMNCREISEMTGININSVAYTIRKTKNVIKNKLKK